MIMTEGSLKEFLEAVEKRIAAEAAIGVRKHARKNIIKIVEEELRGCVYIGTLLPPVDTVLGSDWDI